MPSSRQHLGIAAACLGAAVVVEAQLLAPRTSVAASDYAAASEPRFTIQTSTPASSSFPATTSTSAATDTAVFCPLPTSLPEGLCLTTVVYSLSDFTSSAAESSSSSSSSSASFSTTTLPTSAVQALQTSTSVRIYPCNESSTVLSSTTYALNCISDDGSYTACPSSVILTPTPVPTTIETRTSTTSATQPTITRDCFDENGSTVTCAPSASGSSGSMNIFAGMAALVTNDTEAYAVGDDNNVISQCFDTKAKPTTCPELCPTPFVTAPGPAIIPMPTSSEGDHENATSQTFKTTTTSIRVFQTSPAPIIKSIVNSPAFLTSGRPF